MLTSTIALLVFSLLTWFDGGGHTGRNGWANPIGALGVFVSTLTLLQLSLVRSPHVRLPAPRLPYGHIYLALGGLSFALVFLQFLVGDHGRSRSPGALLGLAAAAALAYGGFRAFRDE